MTFQGVFQNFFRTVTTSRRISQHFLGSFWGPSGDFLRPSGPFGGLSLDILVTFLWTFNAFLRFFSWLCFKDFQKTFWEHSADFLRTFQELSQDFFRISDYFLKICLGISEDFRKTHDFLRIFWQFFGYFSGVSDGVCNQSFRKIVTCQLNKEEMHSFKEYKCTGTLAYFFPNTFKMILPCLFLHFPQFFTIFKSPHTSWPWCSRA